MTDEIPFRVQIDTKNKRLMFAMIGRNGQEASGSMTLDDVGKFIAILSHAQHALVRTIAGVDTTLPIDPNIAFQPVAGGYNISAYEGIRRFAVGIDDASGLSALVVLSASGRIADYRLSSDIARHLGQALLDNLANIPEPQKPQ